MNKHNHRNERRNVKRQIKAEDKRVKKAMPISHNIAAGFCVLIGFFLFAVHIAAAVIVLLLVVVADYQMRRRVRRALKELDNKQEGTEQ